MSDTAETWKKRVASWRASGETAESFSEGRPWKAQTLRWWASRLGREDAPTPVVRLAQLVRSADRGAVIVELLDSRVQVTVGADAPAETVAAVLGILMAREAP
jgi:hypothetical protein